MCKVLQIARSTFYYETEIAAKREQEKAAEELKLKEEIQEWEEINIDLTNELTQLKKQVKENFDKVEASVERFDNSAQKSLNILDQWEAQIEELNLTTKFYKEN